MDAKNAARTVLVIEADGSKRTVWCVGDFPACRRTCVLVRKWRGAGRLYECDGEVCRAIAR